MSEILAPAGGENSAIAAINAGADAIYLGLDIFSARSAAEDFDIDGFAHICRYAHLFGVKVYTALNTVVKESELERFLSSAQSAWNSGADALIVQDIFLGKFLKKQFPEMRLHLSTQAGCCNVHSARLAKEYGFDRVILARETKLEDIAEIAKIIETEVFVQGALCTCFSGQCYMSSFAGGNSGNRGKCKQPCRKLYSIDRNGYEGKAYRISLSDLSVGEKINDYINAGVSSFKIEGRMRRPEYVAAAVSYYRKILKGASANAALSDLKRTFNRGNYTCGLAFGQDKSFISSAVQGHIGEYVGIIKVENAKYILQTKHTLSQGDGLKILRDGSEVGGGLVYGKVKDGYQLNSHDRLRNGDKVFITTDIALNERLLQAKKLLPVKVKAVFMSGKPATVKVNGRLFSGDAPLEKAKNRPLTEEEIARNFEKVGDYPFAPKVTVQTDGIFLATSQLNGLRRRVYAEFCDEITRSTNTVYDKKIQLQQTEAATNGRTAVICDNLNGVQADIGILKPDSYTIGINSATDGFSGEKYLYIPPYLSGSEVEKIGQLIAPFDGIYCENYFGIVLAKMWGKQLFAGTGFNITNSLSLAECGARYVCISKELTMREADEICTDNAFYLSGGGIKVMDLIYCPFEKKCTSCDKRDTYCMKDAEGREFTLRRYRTPECRFEVYNCANLTPCKCRAGVLIDNTVKESENFTKGHSITGIL